MKSFRLLLRDIRHAARIDEVVSFVGEDASGSFGIQAGHGRLITCLVYGLARFKQEDRPWQYLAMPGAMLYFLDNQLMVNTRRFLLSDDYELVNRQLLEVLAAEERELAGMKNNLRNIERNILHRMLEMKKFRRLET